MTVSAHRLALVASSLLLPTLLVATGAEAREEERSTVARLGSAAVRISPPLARLEAGLQLVPAAPC